MKVMQKAAALFAAGALALSLAACGADTTWVAKSGDLTMPAGVYILTQINAYYDGEAIWEEANPDDAADLEGEKLAKKFLKSDVEGKTGSQYVTDAAAEGVKRYFAVEKLFQEKGLTLGATGEASVTRNVGSMWQIMAAFYEQNGISQDSLELQTRNAAMEALVMTNLYGEGGERALTDADYENYYRETRRRVRYIPFALTDDSGQALSEEDAKAVLDEANAYLERAKKGEDMLALLTEYQKDKYGEDLPDTTPGAYDAILTKDSSSPSQAFVDEMFDAPENEPRLIQGDTTVFVAVRVDTLFDRQSFENSKSSLLREMKQEEFDAYLDEQANLVEVAFNDAAIKRYAPEKINFKMPQS